MEGATGLLSRLLRSRVQCFVRTIPARSRVVPVRTSADILGVSVYTSQIPELFVDLIDADFQQFMRHWIAFVKRYKIPSPFLFSADLSSNFLIFSRGVGLYRRR